MTLRSTLTQAATHAVTQAALTGPGSALLRAVCRQKITRLSRNQQPWQAQELLRRRAKFFSDRGHTRAARVLLASGADAVASRPHAALARLEALDLAFSSGQVTAWSPQMTQLCTQAMELADSCWSRGQIEQTAQVIDVVTRVIFHPRLHFADQPSPLSDGPEALEHFLAPLRQSVAWQALCTITPQSPQPTTHSAGPMAHAQGSQATPHTHQPAVAAGERASDRDESTGCEPVIRVLFVSVQNWNFINGIIRDLADDPHYEIRRLDLADTAVARSRLALITARLRLAAGQPLQGIDSAVAQMLSWADVIWAEWAGAGAAWTSLHAPTYSKARLLVRVHSYEASTLWPHLIAWEAVSDLVTVAAPIRQLMLAAVPAIRQNGTRIHTLPNRSELTRFRLPKNPESHHTVAMVGWASPRKDPAWALDVLDRLRAQDPRWRLLLIGPDFPQDLPTPQQAYARDVASRIAALGHAVTVTGATTQVPQFLRQAGVILSASRREGTHEGFIEGVASGAFPVCRCWPDVAAWGGPAALFPSEWVVDTPDEAAGRILAWAGRQEGSEGDTAASDITMAQRDWPHVRPLYEALITGRELGPASSVS